MTSNLGSHTMASGGRLGFERLENTELADEERRKRNKTNVMVEVERHFRPEFLNRLDEAIVFNPLTRVDLESIVGLQLNEVRERLIEHGLTLRLTEAATSLLIDKGYNADYGARPLRRAIERYIEDPMAELLLREELEEMKTVYADIDEAGEKLTFTTEPLAEKPAEKPADEPASSEA